MASFCAGVLSAAGLSGLALAADLPPRGDIVIPARQAAIVPQSPAWLWEIRAGVAYQEPDGPEASVAVNGEVIYGKQYQASEPLAYAFIPRIHVGGSWNTAGKTSFVYAGFTWTFDVTSWMFVEATFGGGIHNGNTGAVPVAGMNALGCSPLFRESVSAGFRLSANWSVLGTVEHMSNASLCVRNRGVTNFSGKVGYRF